MRAAPWLLFVLFLVGCGKGASEAGTTASAPESASKATAGEAVAADASTFALKNESPVGGMALQNGQGRSPAMRTASLEAPPMPRMIVRNGDLTLRVKDVKSGENQVGEVARRQGGGVEASEGSDLAGPNPNLSITLRVPEPRFDATLDALEALGTRLGKTISSEDVTAQAVDLDARLKSLRVQEEAYRAILGAARKISDVLEVQERLTGVRTEIEQIVAQRRNLGDQAARSKIVVTLTQSALPAAPGPEPDWLAQTWGQATASLRAVGRGVASLGIWTATMTPVWLPLALLGAFVVRRTRRPALKDL